MKIKSAVLFLLFCVPFFASSANAQTTFVHLFEWQWNAIANECETQLAPKGYTAVQVSPPQKSVSGTAWWTRYQPVSYSIEGRSGTRAEFASMVARCNAVGVSIYVDAVINHMAASNRIYPDVPFGTTDFHTCTTGITYSDTWSVQNCDLSGLNDLKTESDYVRGKIAAYLNDLTSLGVAGFRFDASKHMPAADIANIKSRLTGNPYIYQEVIGAAGEPIQPSQYTYIGDVTEFNFSKTLGSYFKGRAPLKDLRNIGVWAGWVASVDAQVFVANHDNQRQDTGNIITHKDGMNVNNLAHVFMLAYPYGYPEVMSSYDWTDHDQGPPTTSANTCTGGWLCEHRNREIANMVGFRNTTKDAFVLSNWWDNAANQIAFGRGNLGFVVINGESAGTLVQTLQTGLAAGVYCDVVNGDFTNGACTGATITVAANGTAAFNLAYKKATAIHVNAKVNTTTNPCGYPTMNLRGTFNGWGSTAMTCANGVWTGTATFSGNATDRFKFDAASDWVTNWGDTNNDRIAEVSGSDIYVIKAGVYTIIFNSATRVYSLTLPLASSVAAASSLASSSLTASSVASSVAPSSVAASSSIAATWAAAYFRGVPNAWGATAMTYNGSAGLWETQQTFTGTNPGFKISRAAANYTEAYPAANWVVNTGNGDYKITFNDISKAIVVAQVIPTNSICYNNPNAWAAPYIYFWAPVPTGRVAPLPAWPGLAMTKRGAYYCYDFTSKLVGGGMPTSLNLIFSNNGASQTATLYYGGGLGCYQTGTWKTVQQCGYVTPTVTSSSSNSSVAASSLASSSSASVVSTKTVIYFKNTLNYATPYIHYFTTVPARTNSVWPGMKMKSLNGVVNGGWYSYEFDAPVVTSSGVIFSNNGAPQTANLTFAAPFNCYDGTWKTETACGVPTVTANAGVNRKANINTRQVLSAAATVGNYATASWTSAAWAGTLTGSQVITPLLVTAGTYTVTLSLTTAENTTFTDTMTLTVVPATQGLPERPQLETPLKFPITGTVSTGAYRFVKAFPNLDALFPSPVLVLSDKLNSGLIYVVDKIGTVSVFPNLETVVTTDVRTLLNISTVVRNNHEMGLLSMAFDPAFATNGYIYVYYVYGTNDNVGVNGVASADTILERWTVNSPTNPTGVVTGSKVEILRIPQVGPDHKGGMMQFHPSEGYLYLGVGDGGYGNSAFPQNPVAADPRTNNSGQETNNLLGKMIRIQILTVPGTDGKYYKVPTDNPFVGNAAYRPEIYSYGHRNLWRWAFDTVSPYALWETEVGQHNFEEVNLIVKGKNYGWPVCEGTLNRGLLGGTAATSTKSCTTDYQPPVETEVNAEGKSIIGGFVYRGTTLPALTGKFIFGDYVTKRIYAVASGQAKALVSDAFPQNIASFGTDMSGNSVFITSYGIEYAAQGATSAIYKMVDDNAVAAVIPPKLSGTGLFADLATLVPSTGVIEYAVNTNGWFDGAIPRHFISIPNGQTIGFNPAEIWDMPVGTVLVKHLSIAASGNANKPFTTSVLFRQADGSWQAANYQWNAAGTDADLVTTSSVVADGGVVNRQRALQTPSDCGACHIGSGSKPPLAVGTRQFNGTFNYQGVVDNQLTVFNSIGLFSTTVNNAASVYGRFAAPTDTIATLDLRARSYLHTNCSHCHSSTHMDMRFDTSLEGMHLVGVGAVGGVKRVKPFDHMNSLVYLYQTNDSTRMPRGSLYTNPEADTLFTQWIDAIGAVQTGVSLTSTQTVVDIGDIVTVSLSDLFDNGFSVPTTAAITWSSSALTVMSTSGKTGNDISLTAIAAGTATIGAYSNGFSTGMPITVEAPNPASDLQIIGIASLKIVSGDTQQLVAVSTIAGDLTGVTARATWSSSNTAIASVSATGMLTGGLTAGTATITAAFGGLTATYSVTSVGQGQYVYFKKPSAWAAPTAYIWTAQSGVNTPRTIAFPGAAMNEIATKYGSAWLRQIIPLTWANTTGGTNIVFSNNSATKTADLTVSQALPSWYDNAWLTAAPVATGVDVGSQIQVGNGEVSISGSVNLSGKLFVPGTVVDIKANPVGPGMKFVRWEGTGAAYLLNTASANTTMVVGTGMSFTLLAVVDSITDAHVVGRSNYQSLGCNGCHGSTGTGSPSLANVPSTYTAASLATYIAANMPRGNVGTCTGECASSIAAMIMANAYVAPVGVCNATSLADIVPQDRGFRLLSTLEYNNSIRDLLGLTANVDVTTGRIPADLPVNGFKTDANSVFTNDYAKGYVLAAETAAALVTNIYSLTPGCSAPTCFAQTFGKRAYRRPLSTAEVNELVALQASQGNVGLMTAILSSPSMLYRSEVGVANGSGYFELTDYEVAAMLSYTYWATTPDAALMTAADGGLLSTPAQISAKVTQMLQDPKAKVAFERFITGWLDLEKDIKTTSLSASLKADMKAESVEFVKRTVFDGGTYNTLLTANYSYMTQQLATHYGLTWPGGTGMQRVDYTGVNNSQRRGILGHAGILAIQSASEKTHPVKRGLFVRHNLMCQDFPPPPVGAVLKPQEDPSLTVRERFETAHLQTGCEACHQYIDGIGFGLENYNAKGLYVTSETTDNGLVKTINSLGYIGSLNSAETYLSESEAVVNYSGMDQLANLISTSSNGKACYARQWYRYTRGQREEVSDSCTVQAIGATFKASSTATMLDLMIQFTQTKNYILRK